MAQFSATIGRMVSPISPTIRSGFRGDPRRTNLVADWFAAESCIGSWCEKCLQSHRPKLYCYILSLNNSRAAVHISRWYFGRWTRSCEVGSEFWHDERASQAKTWGEFLKTKRCWSGIPIFHLHRCIPTSGNIAIIMNAIWTWNATWVRWQNTSSNPFST